MFKGLKKDRKQYVQYYLYDTHKEITGSGVALLKKDGLELSGSVLKDGYLHIVLPSRYLGETDIIINPAAKYERPQKSNNAERAIPDSITIMNFGGVVPDTTADGKPGKAKPDSINGIPGSHVASIIHTAGEFDDCAGDGDGIDLPPFNLPHDRCEDVPEDCGCFAAPPSCSEIPPQGPPPTQDPCEADPCSCHACGDGDQGGGGGGDGGENPETDVQKIEGLCAGLNKMLQIQAEKDKEVVAFYTTDGTVFILPMGKNTKTLSSTISEYLDSQGRMVFSVAPNENGAMEIYSYDYSTNPATWKTYMVQAHYHTHPNGENSDIPSDYDRSFAAGSYSGIPKYIFNNQHVIKYNAVGTENIENLSSICP